MSIYICDFCDEEITENKITPCLCDYHYHFNCAQHLHKTRNEKYINNCSECGVSHNIYFTNNSRLISYIIKKINSYAYITYIISCIFYSIFLLLQHNQNNIYLELSKITSIYNLITWFLITLIYNYWSFKKNNYLYLYCVISIIFTVVSFNYTNHIVLISILILNNAFILKSKKMTYLLSSNYFFTYLGNYSNLLI